MPQETHKPGPLKQTNKSHKRGRHRSNREIETANKGKVDVKSLTKRKSRDLKKDERWNKMKQLRKTKKDEAIASKRSIGVEATPPILVIVYSFVETEAPLDKLLDLLKDCQDEAVAKSEREGSLHLSVPRFKLRYEFITLPANDLYALLDAVKVADILLVLHPISLEEKQLEENAFLDAVFSHFLPTTVHVVNGLEEVPIKKRQDTRKNIQRIVETRFPGEKLHIVDKAQDSLQLLHQIGNCKRRRITYKKHRSQVLAEKFAFEKNANDEETGKLIVSGYVRNKTLNANGLVHIPGWGDFQMDMIESAEDPFPVSSKSKPIKRQTGDMDTESSTIIQRSDPLVQECLDLENEPDPMEGEQTWPTAEELAAAQSEKKITKKVVKGTSEYQAAWIIDENEGDGSGDEDSDVGSSDDDSDYADCEMELKPIAEEGVDDSESIAADDLADDEEDCEDNEEFETITVGGGDTDNKYDETMNIDDEKVALTKYREMRMHEMFPDEVDTPLDVSARVRFARYRGLKSFSFSTWDQKENLPSDYSRIFQFENFNRTRRRVLKASSEEGEGAEVGTYVKIHVTNVPRALAEYYETNVKCPLVLFGLLAHEQKMSVLNVVLKRQAHFTEPVKSKEKLIFHIGCRRFACNPIFSGHTNGNKFKYERFLRSDEATVASIYAPITYAPASVSVFKEYSDGSHHLVATGSLMSVNPDRLVIKRIVLGGHPFKINSRSAVARYMFYNREDILWFKPIELRTKYGRKGHIKEPLGTHGHMKCIFDRPITSQDSILMNMYKRIFPKWSYEPLVRAPVLGDTRACVKPCEQEMDD